MDGPQAVLNKKKSDCAILRLGERARRMKSFSETERRWLAHELRARLRDFDDRVRLRGHSVKSVSGGVNQGNQK